LWKNHDPIYGRGQIRFETFPRSLG